jgi:hypothetical protein
VPPLLRQEETLHERVERPPPPRRVIEPVVLRQRLDTRGGSGIAPALDLVRRQPSGLAERLVRQALLRARGTSQVHGPVQERERERGRRHTPREAGLPGVQEPVEVCG